ncbi:MAG: hypothetical protein HY675_24195 [Chloroflexi bacterium]|nr:hypothetical protein [Chloroflexota bacterium]
MANDHYNVLSPWAEVDPVAPKGISPRLTELSDQTIGLFVNSKGGAPPMLSFVEDQLRRRFPALKFSRFLLRHNLPVGDTEWRADFEEWVQGIDAAVTAVGD